MAGKPSGVMDPGPMLKLFGGVKAYRRFVQDGMGEGHREDYYQVEDQRFLGAKGFGERMVAEVEEGNERRVKRKPLGKAVETLARRLKVSLEALRQPDRSWQVSRLRTLIAYALVKHQGYAVGEVASYFGRDQATVSALLSRFSDRVRQDPETAAKARGLGRLLR